MRVAIAQIDLALGDIPKNLEKHLKLLEEARENGADAVIFPELSLTGYFLRDMVHEVAMKIDSKPIKTIAESSKGLFVLFGFVEAGEDGFAYNSALAIEDRKIVGLHRKVYLPTYGMFEEGLFFASGTSFKTFVASFGKFGILICEDAFHPSSFYVLALKGAKFVFVPVASPFRGPFAGKPLVIERIWEAALTGPSLFYQMFTVMVNRVGFDDELGYFGASMVVNPHGEIVFKAPKLEEGLFFVDVNEKEIERAKRIAPFLRDEKPWVVFASIKEAVSRNG